MSKEVFITRLSRFLPNDPVSNDEMENRLGMIDGEPSKAKGLVLRNNGIKTRYYALDENGNATHSNAQMTAIAVRDLFKGDLSLKDVELLTAGTTSPDQFLPSHASMIHGELGEVPIEIAANSGSCCSGMHALKYAYMSLLSGNSKNAIATGSERFSCLMKADKFEKEAERLEELNQNPIIAFEKEFLRWMLSDGAAAVLLEDSLRDGTGLRLDWIESLSYANELETCMYMGAEKQEEGSLKGWGEFDSEELMERSIFSLKQDVRTLDPNIVPYGGRLMKDLMEKHQVNVDDIDHFLPHLSSEYFRKKIDEGMKERGIHIPQEKWFTNLSKVGNLGSASAFFMLEELFNSGQLKDGDRILLMVPESARFSYVYAHLTVVKK